jgi:hypothetical protein
LIQNFTKRIHSTHAVSASRKNKFAFLPTAFDCFLLGLLLDPYTAGGMFLGNV